MKKDNPSEHTELRKKAEARLESKPTGSNAHLSEFESLKLIHELEVHQIELEMQNDELILAETSAREAAEKYSALYDFAPLGYFTLSNTGEITELNLCAYQMIGKNRSRLKNSSFGFFVSHDSKPAYAQFFDQIWETKIRVSCDVTLVTEGNIPMHVHLSGIAAENGKQCLLSAVDITGRRQAEVRLQDSEKKYRNLVENAIIGIYATNWEGDLLFANQAMCRMLEYRAIEDLLNSDIKSRYRDISERDTLVKTLKKSNRVFNYEIELITKTGTPINVLVNSFVSGETIVGMMMDITERKLAETELHKKMEELQRFHNITVGRELSMIELKKEVNELLKQSGHEEKYHVA